MEDDGDFINLDDSEDDLIELAPPPKKLKRLKPKSSPPKPTSVKKTATTRLKKPDNLELTDSDEEIPEKKPKKPRKPKATANSKKTRSTAATVPDTTEDDQIADVDFDDVQWEDVDGEGGAENDAEVKKDATMPSKSGRGDEHELDIKMDVTDDVDGKKGAKNEKKRKRESTGPKKRRGSKNERAFALHWHNAQLLSWLGHAIFSKRSSEQNKLHQAIMLSFLPLKDFEEMTSSVSNKDWISTVVRLVIWFNNFFKVVEPLSAPQRVKPTTAETPVDLTEASENSPPSTTPKKIGKRNSNLSSSETGANGDDSFVHRRFYPSLFYKSSRPVLTQQVAFKAFSVLLDALGVPYRTIWWLDEVLVPFKFADFSLVMPKVTYSPSRFTNAVKAALAKVTPPLKMPPSEVAVSKEKVSQLPKTPPLLWFEVFSHDENRWVPIDLFRGITDGAAFYNQVGNFHDFARKKEEKKAKTKFGSSDCGYIFAVGRHGKLAHVSPRYALAYSDPLFKMGEWTWVMELLKSWNEKVLEDESLRSENDDAREEKLMEDADREEIASIAEKEGFPKALSDYKNHPLYVLERDLLKFEVLRPDHAGSVHTVGEHDVYLRRDVSKIHTADKWIQEGMQVKADTKPVAEFIKFTASNWDMAKKKWVDESEAEMSPYYGDWQVEPFVPPTASNGIVPKNKYGNVYMFKPNMLPGGCTYLKGDYPHLDKSARKIGVDVAPAMVGWSVEQYWSIPVLEGWIICTEHVDAALDAWMADSAQRAENQLRKIRDKATQNWLSLTKQLLLKAKFDQNQQQATPQHTDQTAEKPLAKSTKKSSAKTASQQQNSDNSMDISDNHVTDKNPAPTLDPAVYTPSVSAKANAQHTHTFPPHLSTTDSHGNVTRRCACGYSDSTQRI